MTYSIYGAGTSTNPIKVQIDQAACESKFVPVPYIIKGEETGCDGKTVFYNNIYYPSATELADLSCSCGTGTCNKWEEKWTSSDKNFTDSTYQQTIYYNVEVIKNCEKKPGCDTGCTVGDYWIKKADGKNITVSYEKYTFKDCDTVQRSIVTTTKTCGDGEITIDTGCGSFSFPYKCTTACTDAGSTKIIIRGATFTPVTVEYNGGKVKVSLSYEKVVKDKNCVEHKSRGSIILDATVPACTDKCCFDHPVDVKILKSDILKALGITDTTVKVIYKNKEVGTSLAIPIVQKANPGQECDKNCEYKTTYCVLGSTIKVEYETFWGSKDWTGTKVSPAGGRVRVLFDYLATAIAIDENGKPLTDKDGYQLNPDGTYKTKDGQKILETVCKPYTFNGNDSVIIEVSPCVAEESAEGSGNEKIQGEILYKERTSGCSKTCAEGGTLPCVDEYEYTDVVTNEKYKMNLIKYEVIQDCSGICEPGEYKVYEEVPGNARNCDTTFTGRAKYKTITVDNNCKVTTSEEAYEDMTVQISPNQTTNVVEIVNDYFRITQEAGPCLPPGGCNCDAVEIIGGNYPDVCTSPTYKYEDVHITCEPHEMVEVPFSGLCDGVVVVSGKYKWTGHFECNSGDSITHTREANGATMKVLQDGGCDCYEAEGGEHVVPGENPGPGPGPGPGPSPGPDPKPNCVTPLDNVGQVCDDSTTATQEFIDEGFACDGGHWWNGPLDGENDEGFKAAGDTSGDSIRCKASNLVFEKVDNWIDYEIDTTTTGDFGKGVVRYTIAKNEGSKPRHGILKVKTNENEHPDREFDGHSTSDYFCTKWCNIHFYQKGNGDVPGPTPECTEPSPSSGLDTMLSQCNFEQVLGCYVTPDDTPCTYTYLKAVYESSSGLDTTKSWMIANVFSELTPYDDMASDYFEEAAKTYGGLGKDLYRDKFIYEERIEGAFEYAKFKHNNYSSSQEMAANARAELQDKGITKAKLRPRLHPEKSNPIYFNRNEGVHMLPIIPSSAPSNAAGSSDVTYTQNLINSYFVASDCEQAIKDKAGCGAYLASIMNVNDGDGRYTDFIDMVTDLADAGNNQIKYDSDPHRRWRPGAQQKLTHVFTIPSGGDTNVYLCDCTIQAASYAMCGENCNCTDDVNSFTNTAEFTNGNASFPSGHSAKAYLAFLCCVEVDGNFGDKSRILDYCENRTVVRAHWITDVTAGRLGASMQIGYLNGFEEYHKLIRNM